MAADSFGSLVSGSTHDGTLTDSLFAWKPEVGVNFIAIRLSDGREVARARAPDPAFFYHRW
jgi:hypothetical protein